jgi:hypothetical protein
MKEIKMKTSKYLKINLVLCIVLLFFGTAYSQLGEPPSEFGVPADDFERVGQAGWQFLKIPANAREAAIGGIKAGLGNSNVGAVFNNPAELVYVENFQVAFSDVNWFADIRNQAVALSKAVPNIGHLALSAYYVNYGDMVRTDITQVISPNPDVTGTEYIDKLVTEGLGTFSAYDLAVGFTYSRRVTDRLSFGSTVRYLRSEIDDLTMSNFAIDVGTIFFTGLKSLRIAMLAGNFGPDSKFFQYTEKVRQNPVNIKLPTQFRFGVAYDLLERTNGSPHLLTLALEGVHPNDGPEKLNVGGEYTLMNLLSLRGGYRFNYDEEGLTLGAGINVDMDMKFKLDYAYIDFGRLEEVHIFSAVIGL